MTNTVLLCGRLKTIDIVVPYSLSLSSFFILPDYISNPFVIVVVIVDYLLYNCNIDVLFGKKSVLFGIIF